MKTTIVYILVSDESDFYLEQTLISTYTVRLYHPNTKILLVVDEQTKNTLKGKRNEILKYITNILVINIPKKFNKPQRSRYLKTNLRHYIKGDFLFIDTDTIICGPLNDIDSLNMEIAAVLDNHGDKYNLFTDNWIKEKINIMKWDNILSSPHFNSGVFYVKDTLATRNFYTLWYTNWYKCYENGIYIDQLALRKTYMQCNMPIKELNGIWNCQIRYPKGYTFLNKAKILHYQASDSTYSYKICDEKNFMKIKLSGEIPIEVSKMLNHPQQYCSPKYMQISGKQIEFIESYLYYIYLDYPLFYKFLILISKGYRLFITRIWGVKENIKYIFNKNKL